MPARTRLLGLLPWLLCASAVLLVGLAAFLRVTAGGAATGKDVVAAVLVVAGFASFPLVGAVIAARLPGNPYGWIWCALGVALGVLAVAVALGESRAPAGPAVTMAGYLGFLGLAGLLVFVFLLFPTG